MSVMSKSMDMASADYEMVQPVVMAASPEEASAPPPPPPPPSPGQSGRKPSTTVQARLIAYQGWIQLAGLEPDAILDSAERRVVSLDGYVESRRGRHLVLRVPVQRFEDLFLAVKSLGKVVSSRRSAEDVTEAVEGADLELQLRRTQLAKLKSILQRETKINERASLLQEIRRVSEEIARLEARTALLRKRVQLSTLELDAVALENPTVRPRTLPQAMSWIGSLFEPNHPGWVRSETKGEPLEIGPEFVPNSPEGSARESWQAATADGSILGSFVLKNHPRGNAGFWRAAILHFRGDGFMAPDTFSVGPWSVARLTSFRPEQPVWWIAVGTRDEELHVVQAMMSPAGDRQLAPALRRILQESKP